MFHSRKRNTLNEGVLFGFVFSCWLLGGKVYPLYYNTTGHRLRLRVSGEGQKDTCAEPFPPTAPCLPLVLFHVSLLEMKDMERRN